MKTLPRLLAIGCLALSFAVAAVPVDLGGLTPLSEIRVTHIAASDLITLDWPASTSPDGARASITRDDRAAVCLCRD